MMLPSLTPSILKDFMDIIMPAHYEASALCKALYMYYLKRLKSLFKVSLVFLTIC